MTLPEIIDLFQRLPSGGIFTDENRYDMGFVENTVHRTRAIAIVQSWKQTKRINSAWTQQFKPTFDSKLQDQDCRVIFPCPSPISIETKMDGFLYIGTVDGLCPFRKVVSRAELANYNVHRYTKLTPNMVKVLYSDGNLETYGNLDLEEIMVDGIFSDPTTIPTYNRDYDDYPVSLDLVEIMKNIVYSTEQQIILSQPVDSSPDSQDTSKITNPSPVI